MSAGVSPAAREALERLLAAHRPALQATATDWVTREAVDLRGRRPREETEQLVADCFAAWEAYLLRDDHRPLELFVARVVRLRGGLGFHISTPQRGLLSFKKAVRGRLGELPPELALELVDTLDAAYERELFFLSDAYQAEIVRQQAELAARAQEAREAQTAFLADIGHEVRTPLSSLLGFAELLGRGAGAASPDELAGYLANIRDNARALLDLVDDLVDLARLEARPGAAEPEDLDLWRLVRDVHGDVEAEARHHVRALTLDLPAHLPRYARVDGAKLARALKSLLRTAVHLSPPDGEVRTRVSMPRPGWLRARITDQGRTPLPQRQAWFAGLQQAPHHRGAGPGLAVAVAHRLAQLMGGQLDIEDEPDAIAWRLELPVDEIAELTTTAPPAIPPSKSLEHVLVVPAPDTPRALLEAVFEDAGVQCSFHDADGDPGEAPFDVVLADVAHGLAALPELVKQPALQDVPVVVATTSAAEHREALLEAGAYEVLDKPLDIDQLMGALLSAAARPA